MKYITSIIIASVLLSGPWSYQSYAQDESLSLVEHAVRLRSPGDDWPRHVHLERTIEEAQKATGLEEPFGDEFFRQVATFLNAEKIESWKIQHLLNLLNLLGDERAAPGLVRLIERRLEYADSAFQILAEVDADNPAVDRLIAEGVERVLEGPPYPYRSLQPNMLHYLRADQAIEHAERLKGYAEERLGQIVHPTSETLDEWRDLSNLQSGSAHVLQIARIYQWADADDAETVVGRVLAGRHENHDRLFRDDGLTRILQAIRRRGLVDMFAERAREEIMAEELGSDKTYRLSSILETLRADIDDELRQKIDDSMAERGRRFQERLRREREAAPDGS